MNLWDAYQKIDFQLNKDLLTIPPYPTVTYTEVQQLLESLENPDPAWGGLNGEIVRMVKNPWQRAYQIEYRFKPAKIFNDFMRIIESATYGLMIGNNICTYISMVPVVEAVLRKWSDEYPQIKSKKNGDFRLSVFSENLVEYLNEKNNKVKGNPDFQRWMHNQIKYFDLIIREVFYLNFKKSNEGVKKDFNRNRTLHLLDNIEDTAVLNHNTVRIFLLLDVIAEIYLGLNEENYLKNTFYTDMVNNIDLNLRWKIYLKNLIEAIHFTDMNIINLAFSEKDESHLSIEQKLKFIEQKDIQINFVKGL